MSLPRKLISAILFFFMSLPVAFATGAGKSNLSCQGTIISATDDIVSIINSGKKGQTFCIEGEHRITSTIQLRSGQTLIGTTPDSRISGAVVLSPWHPTYTQGVYYYNGAYANTQPHQQNQYNKFGGNVCYSVTTYLDDLFFRTGANNDQRIMRVLSETEVDPTQAITTQGQAVTAGEAGRFFFDYAHQRIYVSLPNNQDPNTATLDLAISLNNPQGDALLSGPGQSNVTLQNLFIEKGMNYGIYAGQGWTLKDTTVRFIHNIGVFNMMGTASLPATIDDSLFTNNGRLAMHSALSTNLTISNSEMSWNNIANFRVTDGAPGSGACKGYKDAGAFHIYADIGTPSQPAVTINNLWSHHNIGDGLWSDAGTQYTQITNSTLSNNERFGYLHEISCQVLFSGNTVYGNGYPLKNSDITGGGGGVDVSDSNNGIFTSNLIYGNDAGIAFHLSLQQQHSAMLSNACLGATGDSDTSSSVKNNQVLSNAIYSCSNQASIGKVWGPGGTLNSRGNQYESNQYHLADSTSDWFVDDNDAENSVPQDWNTWQQGNHDSQGGLTVGCVYTKAGKVGTTTTLTLVPASMNLKAIGPVVATAMVKPAYGSGMPTGTINLFNGASQVGSAPLNNGAATFSYNPSVLAAGTYSITATYLPSGSFGASTSAAQTLSVQDFQIASNPTTVTVSAPGGKGSTTLTLTPLGGFSQTLSYSCAGLPLGATCTFASASATAETLTIQTTAQSARLEKGPVSRTTGLVYALLLPGLLGILVSVRDRKRGWHGLRLLGLVAVLTVSTLGMSACAGISGGSGSGGSGGNGGNHNNPGTPHGSSSVTVTAATTGANPLSHTVVVTLTVQ